MSDDDIRNLALIEVDKLLRTLGKGLQDYDGMPVIDFESSMSSQNRLICNELSYNKAEMKREHDLLIKKLNVEQHHIYDEDIRSVVTNKGGVFFVYGYGGTGTTFLWKTISASMRSKGLIVLNVTSSGIASLLLPGGRTTHSRFSIPFNIHDNSTCNIKQGSQLSELLVRWKLIIWDEAPMVHKNCIEALDKTLKDIMQLSNSTYSDKIFGGKTMVLGGDFRQILSVIPKGSRQDIVHATINSSYIWDECTVLRLTKNMRLQNINSITDRDDLKQFSEWMAALGDGIIGDPHDNGAEIDTLEDILLKPGEGQGYTSPTLDVVESINDHMIKMNMQELKTYLSSDSACKSDSNVHILADVHTPEFLNSLKYSGVPNHELILKVGTPVMLLRNIDHSKGLCNGTRLLITRLGDHVLEGKVLTGNNVGQLVLIPRLSLTSSDPRLPFKFQRRQYPIIVSYAMSINKSQGQSLSHVGLLLKKPIFSHRQLYVVVSRVINKSGLKILVSSEDNIGKSSTKNVMFLEVFRNV